MKLPSSLPGVLSGPLLLLVLFAQASPASSQSASTTPLAPAAPALDNKTPTIAVDARLVNLPVVVYDKKGALVANLTRDDFTLQVDGHPEPIRYFNRDTDLPLTLGLLVDTSGSVRDALDAERTASASFLETMLTSVKDRAFIIQFARSAELLQDLTNSKPKLQAALKEIDSDPPGFSNNSGNDPNSAADPNDAGSSHSHRGGGTTLYDATFLAAEELMSKQTGRKALILLTDGEDRGSKETLARAIEASQRSNSILYAIYFKGEQHNNSDGGFPGGGRRGGGIGFPGGGYPGGGGGYPGGGGGRRGGNGGNRGGGEVHEDGKKVLARMTDETGGRVFEVSHKQTFEDIYDQIAAELRSEYRLGFTPTADIAVDGYHQIDLATPKDKNLRLQTRDGYYTGQE